MSATASQDDRVPQHRTGVSSAGQYQALETGLSDAPSARSLSMMRQAFGGLLANAEVSLSTDQQRSELERSINEAPLSDRPTSSFNEEKFSYDSVRESDDAGPDLEKFKFRRANIAQDAVASTEFFDYLIAIGGV